MTTTQPKRAALAQSIREAFPEDSSNAQVRTWATQTIAQVEIFLEQLRKARGAVTQQSYSTDASATNTPVEILHLLQQFQTVSSDMFLAAENIRTVIAVRIPELKEEDNLGVAVQLQVLQMLDKLQARLTGAPSGDKSGSGGAPVAGMFIAREYLAARAGIEEKLLKKPSEDEKEGGGPPPPSALLELQQLDQDSLLKVELAAAQLLTSMRAFVNAYALNWKKLIQPRVSNERMVS